MKTNEKYSTSLKPTSVWLKNGEKVKEFESQKETVQWIIDNKICEKPYGHIQARISKSVNKGLSAWGYIFKGESSKKKELAESTQSIQASSILGYRRKRPTTVFDNGVKVAEFQSQAEAAQWILDKGLSDKKKANVMSRISTCARKGGEVFGYTFTSLVKPKSEGFQKAASDPSLMSEAEVKDTFKIRKQCTILSYIEENLLPPPIETIDEEYFYSRKEIYEMIGLKEIPNEPFMTPSEVGLFLGILNEQERNSFIKAKKIPFYYIKKSKGSPRYFLKSEIEAALKVQVKWDPEFPTFVSRSLWLKSILNSVIAAVPSSDFSEKELLIFKKLVVEGQCKRTICEELDITFQGIDYTIRKIHPKMVAAIERLSQGFAKVGSLLDANKNLEAENAFLKDQVEKLNVLGGQEIIKPIEKTHSVRVDSLFSAMGIKSLYEISQRFTRKDAKKFRNIGEGTLQIVDDLLKQNNLWWKVDSMSEEVKRFTTYRPTIKKLEVKKEEPKGNPFNLSDHQLLSLKDQIFEIASRIHEIESKK